jgi:hypothetical protein
MDKFHVVFDVFDCDGVWICVNVCGVVVVVENCLFAVSDR